MISFLRGVVVSKGNDFLEIDVCGVGYFVLSDSSTLRDIVVGSSDITLLIQSITKEGETVLYGFLEHGRRVWFCEFIKISGISGKIALSILSKLVINEISISVQTKDVKAFTSVPGIGVKLATRIVNEIKDVSGDLISSERFLSLSPIESSATVVQDAISALTNLGMQRQSVVKAVYSVFANDNNVSLETLIKLSIMKVGGGNS